MPHRPERRPGGERGNGEDIAASECRPKIAEAIQALQPSDVAQLAIAHEVFWAAIPKTDEGFSPVVRFESITFNADYTVYYVLVKNFRRQARGGPINRCLGFDAPDPRLRRIRRFHSQYHPTIAANFLPAILNVCFRSTFRHRFSTPYRSIT
jgi:hypothetical protein